MDPGPKRSDEAEAVRFLLFKAAIFILVPLVAAGLAVVFLMPK
ncbi:MAG: phosphoribosylformylglycinamidine synthase-associated small membrane protein [Hyphomicrobium sp.]